MYLVYYKIYFMYIHSTFLQKNLTLKKKNYKKLQKNLYINICVTVFCAVMFVIHSFCLFKLHSGPTGELSS